MTCILLRITVDYLLLSDGSACVCPLQAVSLNLHQVCGQRYTVIRLQTHCLLLADALPPPGRRQCLVLHGLAEVIISGSQKTSCDARNVARNSTLMCSKCKAFKSVFFLFFLGNVLRGDVFEMSHRNSLTLFRARV